MKKTVIIILAVLPIVLVITIAFAGRIFSLYRHVAVEKVRFVDELGEEISSDYLLKVNVGETKGTNIQIFPELGIGVVTVPFFFFFFFFCRTLQLIKLGKMQKSLSDLV